MEVVYLAAGECRMEVLPVFGGTIRRLALGSSRAEDILLGDREEEIAENPWFRGRIMFPFCDRIPGGRYRFEGKEYQLEASQEDGSAIHGLIHNRPGRIISKTKTSDSDSLVLSWQLGGDAGYPFELELLVEYRLCSDGSADLTYRAVNHGEQAAPIGFGWHPYFQLPDTEAEEIEITIPCERYVGVHENLMPTGEFPSVDEGVGFYDFRTARAIGKGEYDIAYPLSDQQRREGAVATLSSPRHRIYLSASGAFSYFQLFTPPDRTSVALEPISNVTDAFNREDMGKQLLQPGEKLEGMIGIRFSCLD